MIHNQCLVLRHAGLEEMQVNELVDHLEVYLMHRLFNIVFCSPNSDDEQQDLDLQRRLYTFPKFLFMQKINFSMVCLVNDTMVLCFKNVPHRINFPFGMLEHLYIVREDHKYPKSSLVDRCAKTK